MPWCENCKMEYREGLTVCADCGSQLVEELSEVTEYTTIGMITKEDIANRLLEFLKYSNIETAKADFQEAEKAWVISVADKEAKNAKKLWKAFYIVEQDQKVKSDSKEESKDSSLESDLQSFEGMDENEDAKDPETTIDMEATESNDDVIEKTQKLRTAASTTYVKKQDQYNDLKFTGYTFLIFGVLGAVFIILNLLSVLEILANPLSIIIFTGMIIGILFVGVTSLKKSILVKSQIGEETRITTEINGFLESSVTKDFLKENTDDALSNEVNYFNQTERIKELITEKFGELDTSYLDQVVDEFYNRLEE